MELRQLLTTGLLLLCCACTPPQSGVVRTQMHAPPPVGATIYIVPFVTVLTPTEMGEEVFDRFVDDFNTRAGTDYDGVILKAETTAIDSNWLNRQYYATGEIFAYREESGCCSTALRLKARLHLFQPESPAPVANVEVPVEIFFDHDRSTLELEKANLITALATRLGTALYQLVRP